MSIELASGFRFDYDNLYGEGKVTAADLDELRPALAKAHAALKAMRETGVIRGHLSKDGEPEKVLFSQLPHIKDGNLNNPASIARLAAFSERAKGFDVVVSFGIGGSYLGNKVLFDTHCGEFWNSMTREERGGYPKLYFSGNNIDPRRTSDLIRQIRRLVRSKAAHGQAPLKLLMVVISKSGGTLDTMSNFMVAYDALRDAPSLELEIVAVTDPNEAKPTVLKQMAIDHGWQTFSVPDGVGGRFSVFSEVGLVTAACIGFDIAGFLRGARDMDAATQSDDPCANPAMLNAALKFIAGKKYGRNIEVMMPYGDYLKSTSEWYIQLLAESLGKHVDRSGNVVNYGRTPVVAVGTTDMHSQTQQHQEGALNKVVQFVRVAHWDDDPVIPNAFPGVARLESMSGLRMSQALDVARQSNADALASAGRFSALFTLPRLTPYHLGELLYLLAMSVAYEGELADVDAFDQPGVEAYKRFMATHLAALKK